MRGELATNDTFLYGHDCFNQGVLPSTDCGPVSSLNTQFQGYGQAIDPYTGASFTGSSVYNTKNTSDCTGYNYKARSTLTYDLDGRQSSEPLKGGPVGTSCYVSIGSVDTRSYDAENHVVSDNCTWTNVTSMDYSNSLSVPPCSMFGGNSGSNTTLGWGPTGKLRIVNGLQFVAACSALLAPLTLHWDGNQLLFVTDSSGKLVQTTIETLAGIENTCAGTPMEMIDRDFSGTQVAASHAPNWGERILQSLVGLRRLDVRARAHRADG